MSFQYRKLFQSAQKSLEDYRYADADKALTELVASHGEAAEAFLHRAYVRLKLRQFELARQDAERAVVLAPESGVAKMVLGEVLIAQKEFIRAYEVLHEACRIEKDNGRAHFAAGLACRELSKTHEAADHFEAALQFDFNYSFGRFMAEGFFRTER